MTEPRAPYITRADVTDDARLPNIAQVDKAKVNSASNRLSHYYSMTIWVEGEPRPKQSYRALKSGGGYQPKRVKEWQNAVAAAARKTMDATESLPQTGNVIVELSFVLSNNRRVDLDNLSKGTLDALRGILYEDDCQITSLCIEKRIDKRRPGVLISVDGEYFGEAK